MKIVKKVLTPISRKRTLVEEVIYNLSEYILEGLFEGSLKRGDKLPSERELAEWLNVGRSTIREATKILLHLNLIEVKMGQGTFISDGTSEINVAPLTWGLILNQQSFEELLEARITIEEKCVELATHRANSKEIKLIENTLYEMEKAINNNNKEKIGEMDVLFHIRVAEAAHNSVLYQTLRTIRSLMKIWISKVVAQDPSSHEGTLNEHRIVYYSMLDKDTEGARIAMKEHIFKASNRLQKLVLKNMK